MPAIFQALVLLASSTVVRAIVTRVLIALGVSFATYTGVGALFAYAGTQLASAVGGLPSVILTMVTIGKLPNALNVVLSAYTAALTLRGLTAAGSISRVVWGGAGSVAGS